SRGRRLCQLQHDGIASHGLHAASGDASGAVEGLDRCAGLHPENVRQVVRLGPAQHHLAHRQFLDEHAVDAAVHGLSSNSSSSQSPSCSSPINSTWPGTASSTTDRKRASTPVSSRRPPGSSRGTYCSNSCACSSAYRLATMTSKRPG